MIYIYKTFLSWKTPMRSLLMLLICTQVALAQNISLRTQAEIDAFDPSITTIDGNFTIGGSYEDSQDVVDLSNLSNIESVEGVLTISRCDNLNSIDGLESINYVKQNVRIHYNKSLKDLDGLSSITKVNAQLQINDNAALVDISGLSSIDSIDGSLSFWSNAELTNLDGLQSVIYVKRDLHISSNAKLENIDGLSSLTSIGEEIKILLNESLTSIDGLASVAHVGSTIDISSNAALLNFHGLSFITEINGDFQSLANHSLQDLRGLHNIDTIQGHVWINNNDLLSNIDGLSNLKYVGDRLQFYKNEILPDVNGLASVNFIGGELSLNENPMLTNYCGVQHLLFNPELVVGGIRDYEDVLAAYHQFQFAHYNCLKSHLGGDVYYDFNQNKIKDSDEFGVPNINVNLNNDGFRRLTNNDGRYDILVQPSEQYDVQIDLDENWEITTDSMSYSFIFDTENIENRTKDFGLINNQPYSSAKINLTSEDTRCNSEVEFYIRALNDGFTINSGQVVVHLDPNVTYISSSPEMILDGQTLVFDVDTLYPYQSLDIVVNVDMPSEQFTGEILEFTSEIYLENQNGQLDIYDENNFQSVVLCSFDPNDKQVSPPGVKDENYTLIDDELAYTIRFQNTGNAPAINILIIDTLDERLDMETFNVVNSSFPMQTSIKDRVVSFRFNNIFLIDSLTNEPESHGFINYTIKVNEDIEELDVIRNTAHIIFDSNPAIVTNTTENTMVESICDDKNTYLDESICEGEDYLGFEESGSYVLEYAIGITCDSFVHLNLTVIDTTIKTIDTIVCPELGFLGLTEAGTYFIDTFNIETGCLEQLVVNLMIYDDTDPACLVGVNSHETSDISIYPNPTTGEISIEGLSINLIRLLNTNGRLIKETEGNKLDLTHLANGVYFLEIWDGTRSNMFKIVKI